MQPPLVSDPAHLLCWILSPESRTPEQDPPSRARRRLCTVVQLAAANFYSKISGILPKLAAMLLKRRILMNFIRFIFSCIDLRMQGTRIKLSSKASKLNGEMWVLLLQVYPRLTILVPNIAMADTERKFAYS